MAVIAYTRVSTEQQAHEGVSMAAQAARINAWAESMGHSEVKVFQDAGISASRMDTRPGLLAALAVLGKGDVLVVYSLSRLARSTRDTLAIAERMEKVGADLVSLSERIDTSGASGKMMFRMLAVLAEFERELISERTVNALRHKRLTGFVYGHVPFGYNREGDRLEPAPDELAVIDRMREMREEGYSLQGLSRWLNKEQVPTKQGGKWYAATVKCVLEREQPNIPATH